MLKQTSVFGVVGRHAGVKEMEPASGPLEQQPPGPCTPVSHEDLSVPTLARALPEAPPALRPLCPAALGGKRRDGRAFCPFSAQQSLGPPRGPRRTPWAQKTKPLKPPAWGSGRSELPHKRSLQSNVRALKGGVHMPFRQGVRINPATSPLGGVRPGRGMWLRL